MLFSLLEGESSLLLQAGNQQMMLLLEEKGNTGRQNRVDTAAGEHGELFTHQASKISYLSPENKTEILATVIIGAT